MASGKLKSDKLSKLKKIKLGKIGKAKVEVGIVEQNLGEASESEIGGGFEIVEDVDIDDSSDEVMSGMFNKNGDVGTAVNARLHERQSKVADHHIQLRIPARYGVMYKALTSPMKKALKDVYIEALVALHSGVSGK